MSRFCGACGASIDGDESFCGSCGSAVATQAVESAPSSAHVVRSATKTNTQYDPDIINRYANWLYDRATTIVVIHALVGAAIGAGPGLLLLARLFGSADVFSALIGGIIGGAIGYWIGSQKAYWLKLQAQVALCQVQIEYNTRALREHL